jgi:dimethylargininase
MQRTLALTRAVPASIAACELTHVARAPIDLALARAQHAVYEHALAQAGCEVFRLPELPEHPDSVFVEDVAVVLDEIAIVTRPGALSRRGESESAAEALRAYRPLLALAAPATLDGGDVLVLDRTLFVGLSRRTNAAAVTQLRALLAPHAYQVEGVQVESALHLKTAVTRVAERELLVNPRWVDARHFPSWEPIEIAASEPFAANALWVGGALIHAAAFPRTAERLRARGIAVTSVDASELAKAEGGVTCCALLVTRVQ